VTGDGLLPERAPVVRSSGDEPASSRQDARVPEVEAWQHAADGGAAARAAAELRRAGPAWTPASAALPASLRDELVDWCRAGLPNEACGLLVGLRVAEDGGIPTRFVGLRNAAASPYRYLIDPDEQLRVMLEIDDADEVIWGIVHSHVASAAAPSMTDVGLAAYPDAVYLICSFADEPPQVRGWTIRDGSVGEVVLEPR
jgi:proteasome lid subunit RPN8/RPN11